MVKQATIRAILLTITTILLSATIGVLACGPAAPGAQSGNETPSAKPTPTATPHPRMVAMGRMEVDIDQPLTFYRDKWATRKAEGRGEPEEGEEIKRVDFVVYTSSGPGAMEVAIWLREQGVIVNNDPATDDPKRGVVGGLVNENEIVNFLDDFAAIDTVLVIHYISPGRPQSKMEAPNRSPVQALHGIEPWHAAGVRGTGLNIGVIDEGFEGINSYIEGASAVAAPTALCFDENREVDTTTNQDNAIRRL